MKNPEPWSTCPTITPHHATVAASGVLRPCSQSIGRAVVCEHGRSTGMPDDTRRRGGRTEGGAVSLAPAVNEERAGLDRRAQPGHQPLDPELPHPALEQQPNTC